MRKKVDRLLTVISSISVIFILSVLMLLAVDIASPPEGAVGYYVDYSNVIFGFIFLCGTLFAPGTIIIPVYIFYARRHLQGKPKSYIIETLTIIIAFLTVYTFVEFLKA
ncbi:hypothetical protein QT397_02065 (plasmid) [Microbulbifer sp. MKSA007]|nr:hypothetical protein QT397_02065 [Microbulbifer sp. MKSA007]